MCGVWLCLYLLSLKIWLNAKHFSGKWMNTQFCIVYEYVCLYLPIHISHHIHSHSNIQKHFNTQSKCYIILLMHAYIYVLKMVHHQMIAKLKKGFFIIIDILYNSLRVSGLMSKDIYVYAIIFVLFPEAKSAPGCCCWCWCFNGYIAIEQ